MNLSQKNKIFLIQLAFYLLLFFGFLYSVNFYTFIYDGYHHGLIYSYAKDLIAGEMPYKKIWLTYGIVQPIINGFFLIFYDNLITIQINTIFFYYLGIFYLYKISIKNLGIKNSVILALLIIFNHPIPHNVWPNYYAFFFIIFSFYILTLKNKYKYFYSGLIIGLTPLIRTEFIYVLFIYISILFLLIFFIKRKKFDIKLYILSSLLPLIFFIFFLLSRNLLDIWLNYFNIYKYFLIKYETTQIELLLNFLKFYSYQSFFNIINEPQYILISITLILNLFFLFFIFKKNLFFFKISLLSLILSILCIQAKQLMNPYTSVIIGLLPLLYFLIRIKKNDYYKIFIYIALPISIYSFCLFIKNPSSHVETFKTFNYVKSNQKELKNKVSFFSHTNWPDYRIHALNKYFNKKNSILLKCKIQYFDNLTYDTFFSIPLKLDRIRTIPFLTLNKISDLDDNFNKDYKSKINNEILNKNIILLIDEYFIDQGIDLNNKYYSKFFIKINNEKKSRNYYLYYPKNCK